MVAIRSGIRCTEFYGTYDGKLLGYVIQNGAQHDAYGKYRDGTLLYMGNYERHEDALALLCRCLLGASECSLKK